MRVGSTHSHATCNVPTQSPYAGRSRVCTVCTGVDGGAGSATNGVRHKRGVPTSEIARVVLPSRASLATLLVNPHS